MWRCRCECGREVVRSGGDLRDKRGPKSCPTCSRTRHGHCSASGRTREYSCYRSMLSRCKRDHRYLDKEVKVCQRWLGRKGFKNFLEDMGPCPSDEHSIDRQDNAGDYDPGNCRWATQSEQMHNTDVNVWVTMNGVTKVVCDWLKESIISVRTYYTRIHAGMTPEEALSLGPQTHAPKSAEHRRKLSESQRKALTEEQKDVARNLGEQGWAFARIARELGVSASTIARLFGRTY